MKGIKSVGRRYRRRRERGGRDESGERGKEFAKVSYDVLAADLPAASNSRSRADGGNETKLSKVFRPGILW